MSRRMEQPTISQKPYTEYLLRQLSRTGFRTLEGAVEDVVNASASRLDFGLLADKVDCLRNMMDTAMPGALKFLEKVGQEATKSTFTE